MIIPFKREWLRSPVFVGVLVLLAVVQWTTAIREIQEARREAEFKREVARKIVELRRAIEAK